MDTEKDMKIAPESDKVSDVNIVPINSKKALESYTEEERAEVLSLAQNIDVRKIENVMGYGSNILTKTFEQCRSFSKR